MFNGKKILAVIIARGGSKGVPGKNIKIAGGKPLIAWIIEASKQSQYIDQLIVSSDDSEIISVAKSFGCEAPFVRPAAFAHDKSTADDVILHALNNVPGFDYIIALQPTSPLIINDDIDGCIDFCVTSEADSVVTIVEPAKSPYWTFTMEKGNKLLPVFEQKYFNKQRQELPVVYIPTGAVKIAESKWFERNKSFYSDSTLGYLVPEDRCLDIDSEFDFKVFETIISGSI